MTEAVSMHDGMRIIECPYCKGTGVYARIKAPQCFACGGEGFHYFDLDHSQERSDRMKKTNIARWTAYYRKNGVPAHTRSTFIAAML